MERRGESQKFDAKTGLNVSVIAVYMVFLTIFLDTIGATISTPALPYYASKFGCTNAQIGYLFGAWSLTSTIFAPGLGKAADRFGRRTVLLVSLLGAGTAALLQGFALNYYMLLSARAFSGIWAAVGSTAQVYLADCSSPEMLPTYMSRLAAVPGLAMIFGPGLGGGLSQFGLSVPIIVDGCVSLFAAFLLFLYLPESAAWLESINQQKSHHTELTPLNTSASHHDDTTIHKVKEDTVQNKPKVQENTSKNKFYIWLLCLAQLFNGITFSTLVSMLAISLKAKLDFDALHVGYTFVGLAIVMVLTSIWLNPWYTNRFGTENAAIIGTLFTALGNFFFAFSNSIALVFFSLALARVAQSLRGASFGTIVAQSANISNRGATMARVQVFLNCGRLIGPVLAGHIADTDPNRAPWLLAGTACLISTFCLFISLQIKPMDKKTTRKPLIRGYTDLKGAPIIDECPDPQEVAELGAWMADLLTKRHYQFVTHKHQVRAMIQDLLPELSTDSSEAHVQDLERLVQHAEIMQAQFQRHGNSFR
uniref:Major facilitator superfamily (MFS) profile domain-containing protein n=1 Tax=Aureoumbra lagunensis TaxID=44058 RepID=A0A6S8E8T2_9STRA|mmetsp:Transcript_7740/g.9810  ORF Transcript_7740/g.9810 Transcript_7740/m.9810 type:complete len:536 (-) Transcript_7740:1789-3396(-)